MAQKKLPVVQTAGLTKIFRDFWLRPRVEAVKDLNLEIRPGEIFGLLGPNGSGKTTTIKMLLGLLYPTKGRIALFGKSPTDVAVKSRIGFLPEESYLYRYLVAHETLDYYGRLFRLPGRIRKERTEKLLEMVGLTHEAKRPVGEYSKGMARRIGLAQALINDPEFLILDEPTSGLDPIGARQIKDVIRDLGRKGKTILLSSHMLADVEDVCDRVIIMYGGQEMASGNIEELLREEDRTQITLPAVSDETIARVREVVAQENNKEILDVTSPRQKLESYFLQIVGEAQRKNIRTSGARAAGAVPEFLKKSTQEESAEFITSLVDASSRPVAPIDATAARPGPTRQEIEKKQAEQVLAQLMPQEAADETTSLEADAGVEAPVRTPVEPAQAERIDADAGVIDSLLQTGGDDWQEKDA
ncbi:MAG: ABC transporter ATP-binding protein [Phycisphaerae bacterium]